MGSDIGKGGICGQILLVIINIIFIIMGIIAVAIGIWAIVSGNTFGFVTGSQLLGGSALLIIIGGVIIVIAAVGMFGAMCKNRVLLVIYALVVLVCVILEIVGGILAFVYRDVVISTQRSIEENLIRSYNTSRPGSEANRVLDVLQTTFSCCGFINASDWSEFNVDAIVSNEGHPPFCLKCDIGQEDCATFEYVVESPALMINITRNFNTTTAGCSGVSTNALLGLTVGVGVVGIIFGLFEIIGIIVALLLCCCISRAKEQTVV